MTRWLYEIFEKAEPLFKPGGKFEKLYPLFEAKQSFMFGSMAKTAKSPHIRDHLDTKRFMITVVIALLPAMLFGIYNAGYQAYAAGNIPAQASEIFVTGLKLFLPILIVTFVVGGFWEVLFSIIRKHEINEGFLVTGMLFPLIMPPTIPLWQVALGISFGVVIGKEIFGGTGKNFLNPALTGRAFIFFAYPGQISGEVWTYLGLAKDRLVDGYSGATSLAIAAATPQGESVIGRLTEQGYDFATLFWGLIPGSIGETSVFCALLGAAILLITGIASWRTMAGCVLGAVGMTLILNWIAPSFSVPFLSLSPLMHLAMGGFAFGTVFMATDPVSSPHIDASKWIYGLLIGALTIVIRCINPAYPEGMMLAILLMNVFAPLIDHVVMKNRFKKRIPHVI